MNKARSTQTPGCDGGAVAQGARADPCLVAQHRDANRACYPDRFQRHETCTTRSSQPEAYLTFHLPPRRPERDAPSSSTHQGRDRDSAKHRSIDRQLSTSLRVMMKCRCRRPGTGRVNTMPRLTGTDAATVHIARHPRNRHPRFTTGSTRSRSRSSFQFTDSLTEKVV